MNIYIHSYDNNPYRYISFACSKKGLRRPVKTHGYIYISLSHTHTHALFISI